MEKRKRDKDKAIELNMEQKFLKNIIRKENERLSGKVVTKLSQVKNYCPAEEYHQRYLEKR